MRFVHCSTFIVPYLPRPEMNYRDTNGIATFVGLWFVSRPHHARHELLFIIQHGRNPEIFCIHDGDVLPRLLGVLARAANRVAHLFASLLTVKTGTGFFGWLEGQVEPRLNEDEDEL